MKKVIHHRDKCIGCGNCVVLCDEFFEMGDDGKVNLKGATKNKKTDNFELELNDLKCIPQAAESCPVQAIEIVNL